MESKVENQKILKDGSLLDNKQNAGTAPHENADQNQKCPKRKPLEDLDPNQLGVPRIKNCKIVAEESSTKEHEGMVMKVQEKEDGVILTSQAETGNTTGTAFCYYLQSSDRSLFAFTSATNDLVGEYYDDYIDALFALEKKRRLRRNYLDGSGSTLTGRNRQTLVHWLAEYAVCFEMTITTLFLAVNILDKFLAVERQINLKDLQLYGLGVVFIATKYEENCTLDFELYDDMFSEASSPTINSIAKIEAVILLAVHFELSYANPKLFLDLYFQDKELLKIVDKVGRKLVKYLSCYIMELSIVNYQSCHICPKYLAAGALTLSMMILGKTSFGLIFTPDFQKCTRTKVETLKEVLKVLAHIYRKVYSDKGFQAVRLKYAESSFAFISRIKETQPENWQQFVFKPTTDCPQK